MIKSSARVALTLFVVAFIAIVALAALAWTTLPFDGASLIVDGERIVLSDVTGWHVAAGIVVALVAAAFAAIVAVLAVLFGLACAALGLTVAAIATVGSLLLVASPLLLVGWLVWLLARPRPSRAPLVAAT